MREERDLLLSYDLQRFADGPGGEKTEEPTAKKLTDARKEGQVAKSQDLVTAFGLLGLFIVLKAYVGRMGVSFMETYRGSYQMISSLLAEPFTKNTAHALVQYGIARVLLISAPFYVVAVLVAFVVNVYQVKWKITTRPLTPKFTKFNPVSGFKRIFSKDKIVELLKAVLKIGVIAYVVYSALRDQWGLLRSLYDYSLLDALGLIGNTVINLGLEISALFLAIALADYLYQKFKFRRDMRMTKQEVKDEYKQTEGDPQVKGAIRRRMTEASRRRMMQALPQADVVITNPTHLAVALQYDKDTQAAPVVIAKGADHLAEKIKEAAREHDIEIVENKPLARMLYYNVEIGMEIPPELYQTVAEILAYVYQVKGKL